MAVAVFQAAQKRPGMPLRQSRIAKARPGQQQEEASRIDAGGGVAGPIWVSDGEFAPDLRAAALLRTAPGLVVPGAAG